MANYGYDDWQIDEDKWLDPSEGSAYVEGVVDRARQAASLNSRICMPLMEACFGGMFKLGSYPSEFRLRLATRWKIVLQGSRFAPERTRDPALLWSGLDGSLRHLYPASDRYGAAI